MKERNFISKLLRDQTGYFDAINSDSTYWKQLLLSLAIGVGLLFVYAALAISLYGWEQALISGLKLIILVFSSLALCLPTFYIFSAFRGSELELKEITGLFSGFALYVALLVVALLPVNWLFAFSGSENSFLSLLFFLFITVGVLTGINFIKRGVIYLNEKLGGKVDHSFLTAWLLIFGLVMMQMASNLGPWFDENKRIFREERQNFLETMFGESSYEYDGYNDDVHCNCDDYYESSNCLCD